MERERKRRENLQVTGKKAILENMSSKKNTKKNKGKNNEGKGWRCSVSCEGGGDWRSSWEY